MFVIKKQLKIPKELYVGRKICVNDTIFEITFVKEPFQGSGFRVYGREIPKGGKYMVGNSMYIIDTSTMEDHVKNGTIEFLDS